MTFQGTNFKSDLRSRVDDRLTKEADDARAWRAVCKLVDARDMRTCRACGQRTNPDALGLLRGHRHHIIYRSARGPDESWNLLTLCPKCHNDEHQDRLQIRSFARWVGADGPLEYWKKDAHGEWFLWRRELSVGRFDKD